MRFTHRHCAQSDCATWQSVIAAGLAALLVLGLALAARPAIAQNGRAIPGLTAEHDPDAARFIENLAARAIDIYIEEGLSVDERRQRFRHLVVQSIAVNGVSRFVLGRHWQRASEAERNEYTALFRDVIIPGWADRLFVAVDSRDRLRRGLRISRDTITVTQAVPVQSAPAGQRTALVYSLIAISEGPPVRVVWRVATTGKDFKLTDVLIQGVSMAQTQRDQMASVIRQHGGQVAGLITILRDLHEQNLADARLE